MISQKEREKLEELISLIFELQEETWPPQGQDNSEAIARLIQYAQVLGLKVELNDPQFLQILLIKILEIYQKPLEKIPSIPPNLKELVEIYKKDKEEEQKQIKRITISPQAYQQRRQMVEEFKKTILEVNPQIPEKVAETMAEIATTDTVVSLSSVAQAEFFPEEDKKQVAEQSQKIIKENLQRIGQKPKKEISTEKIVQQAQQIAAQPIIMEASKKMTTPIKEEETFVFQELPPEIIQKLNQATQVESYSPAYTLLHPKALRTLIQRTFYTIPAKIVQTTAPETSVEFQKMALGFFPEDFRETASRLKSWGLDEKHPIFQYLKNQADRFEELQKTIPIRNRRGDIIGFRKSRDITTLECYFNYIKHTGKWQGVIDYGGQKINLVSSPNRLWDQGGYGLSLKQNIDRFRFISKIYQKVFHSISRGKYDSLGVWVQKFTYGKVLKPILTKLGKTAAGQAIKAGAKKAAGWLATKAGIKLGMWAAGAATAAPSAGVSLLIATAVEIGTRLLKKIWDKVKTIIRDPEKALMAIGAGILALVFIPMPFALIAILPLTIGSLGLITFIAAPATLGAIGGGVGTFFTALAAPIVLPIAAFIIILFSVLAGLTLLIVMVVSGAFILPKQISEVTPTTISPYYSEYFEITKTADRPKLNNDEVDIDKEATIKYTITIKPKGNYVLSVSSLEENFTVFKETLAGLTVDSSDCQFTAQRVQEAIEKSQPLECSITIDSRFKNSAISNSVTLQTSVENEVGIHRGIASAVVIIGNPPMLCPKGWPTSHGYITQGPNASYSHRGDEAIDIGGVGNTTEVYATHQGIAEIGYQASKNGKPGAGYFVKISGSCLGQPFSSNYYHLKAGSIKVKTGDIVVAFQSIGTTDCSGMPICAPHLHYEFMPYGGIVKMIYNYIPKTVPRGCDGNCNISW